MSADKTTIRDEFTSLDAARASEMLKFRQCAALTLPTTLPREGATSAEEIPGTFQSLGADAVTNMTGKLLIALFSQVWFRYKVSADLSDDEGISAEQLAELEARLYAREMKIHNKLNGSRFRTNARVALEHIIVTGNTLAHMKKKEKLRVYRLDRYVQRRADDGEVLSVITFENIDPVKISDEELAKANLTRDQLPKVNGIHEPLKFYTKASLQQDGNWLIEQEVNDVIIRESTETVTPYFPVGYVEMAGENYSRGPVEERLGDMRSYNGLSKALNDGAVAASRIVPFIDPGEGIEPEDLMDENGIVKVGRVVAGVVQGAGFLKVDKLGDFSFILERHRDLEKRLGKSFLLETEANRDAERVTATEVMLVARQLDGALGGIYSHIADEFQLPLLLRTIHQMELSGEIQPLPEDLKKDVDIEILTGIQALGRAAEMERLMQATQTVAQLPEALASLDIDRIVADVFRGMNLDGGIYIKPPEVMEAEAQMRIRQSLQEAAGAKAIDTIGNIAENNAAAEPAGA